jgi:hypothetical protein
MTAKGIAVDAEGRYCGLVVATGEMAPAPPGLNGYCGADCQHCARNPFYAIQNGVWVCGADYDYPET